MHIQHIETMEGLHIRQQSGGFHFFTRQVQLGLRQVCQGQACPAPGHIQGIAARPAANIQDPPTYGHVLVQKASVNGILNPQLQGSLQTIPLFRAK
jgi:hypothetical protein